MAGFRHPIAALSSPYLSVFRREPEHQGLSVNGFAFIPDAAYGVGAKVTEEGHGRRLQVYRESHKGLIDRKTRPYSCRAVTALTAACEYALQRGSPLLVGRVRPELMLTHLLAEANEPLTTVLASVALQPNSTTRVSLDDK